MMFLLEEQFIPEETKNKMMNILVGTKHESFKESALADLVDVLPVIGDISNAIRTVREQNESARNRQKLDLLLGALPPPAGEIFDIITPTNAIKFCSSIPHFPNINKLNKNLK